MKNSIYQFLNLPPFGPLNGYLVLELGGNIAGPIATARLAREGAQVIKIELASGDPARSYLSHAIFTSCNAAKASIVVNKSNEKDLFIYENLLKLATVIVDNRSPDAKARDQPLQQFLHSPKLNPVIFCSIVGYDSQEYHNRPALDVAVQAEIGMAMTNGPAYRTPLKVGFVVIDTTTGWEAASSIKSHLLAFERKQLPLPENKVIFLEQSMAKTGAMLLSGQYLTAFTHQQDIFREGNRDLWIAPFSFYQTQDDMISLAIIGDKLFATFCEKVLSNSALCQKYPTNQSRLDNIEAFEKELKEILLQKSANHWITLCQQYGVVCSKVNTIHQMLQEPFGKKMISFTAENTPIMADPCFSSAYPNPIFNEAPKLNQHYTAIENFIERMQPALQRGENFAKMTAAFCLCKKQPVLNAFDLHKQSAIGEKTSPLHSLTAPSPSRASL